MTLAPALWRPSESTQNPLLRLLPTVFWVLVIVAVVAGRAGSLQYLFPLAALVVGGILFLQNPPRFITFVWWLWFLTPEIRRFIDFKVGWNSISPVMITPFLVGGLTIFTLIAHAPLLRYRAHAGFALVVGGLLYAYIVGIAEAGPAAATFGLLNWLVPVMLGLHVAFHWPLYPQIRDAVLRTFVWGMIVVGGYGLVQYFLMPGWDAYWMISVGLTNQGLPLPLQVRVFSTLNSPGPLAFLLVAGVVLLLVSRSPFAPLAGALALGSLMLSLVRAAWLALALAAAYLLATMPGVHKVRLIVIASILAVAAVPILSIPEVNRAVMARFDTFSSIGNDTSYQERQEFYGRFLMTALSNIRGAGIGTIDTATKLSNDGKLGEMAFFDSGLMRVPYELGWPGAVAYVAGVFALMLSMFRRNGGSPDVFARCAEAIVVSTLFSLVFELTLIKVTGVNFWFFLGIALAAKHYALAMGSGASLPIGDHGR
jgi:hypothetical protein